MSARSILALAASLIPLAMTAAPAQARAGGDPDGLLASLPTHAPAGVCYARVRQDAQFTPPGPARARWRLQPGSPGPVWCLVTEPGAPSVLIRGERAGWIRVLCDGDATPARIGALQRRLHARGLYEGADSGRYDEATAAAMRRFQRRAPDGGRRLPQPPLGRGARGRRDGRSAAGPRLRPCTRSPRRRLLRDGRGPAAAAARGDDQGASPAAAPVALAELVGQVDLLTPS